MKVPLGSKLKPVSWTMVFSCGWLSLLLLIVSDDNNSRLTKLEAVLPDLAALTAVGSAVCFYDVQLRMGSTALSFLKQLKGGTQATFLVAIVGGVYTSARMLFGILRTAGKEGREEAKKESREEKLDLRDDQRFDMENKRFDMEKMRELREERKELQDRLHNQLMSFGEKRQPLPFLQDKLLINELASNINETQKEISDVKKQIDALRAQTNSTGNYK